MGTKRDNPSLIGNWYRMQRGWQSHPVFRQEPYSERDAWIWLVDTAVFAPEGKRTVINLKPIFLMRGQVCFGLRFLAEKWGWNLGRVHRYLKRLKKHDMIWTDTTTGQTVITIRNYDKYQFMPKGTETGNDTE